MVADKRRDLWDRNSRWWTQKYVNRDDPDYEELLLPLITDLFQNQKRVLDIGGGEGRVSRSLAIGNTCDVTCADFSFLQIATAKNLGRGPTFVQAAADNLPFLSGSFDGALACLVFEHLENFEQAVDEASRILIPDGRFVLVLNHPVTQTSNSGFVYDHTHDPPEKYWRIAEYLTETSQYEEVEKGIFIPFEHRTISRYINTLVESGFVIERFYEPAPSDEFIGKNPEYENVRAIPRLMIVICTK